MAALSMRVACLFVLPECGGNGFPERRCLGDVKVEYLFFSHGLEKGIPA
jgi:hypothetical protein